MFIFQRTTFGSAKKIAHFLIFFAASKHKLAGEVSPMMGWPDQRSQIIALASPYNRGKSSLSDMLWRRNVLWENLMAV